MITHITPTRLLNPVTSLNAPAEFSKMHKSLASMLPGETGIVDSCCGGDCCDGEFASHLTGDNRLFADRMQIMGICPGRQVKVIRSGNPLIIRVLGTHLGVANDLAKDVLVLCDHTEKSDC